MYRHPDVVRHSVRMVIGSPVAIHFFANFDIFKSLYLSQNQFHSRPPEAALLLVSTKNRDLWPSPTPEVRDSRTSRHSAHVQSQVWQIWLVLVSIYCVYKAIQKRNAVGLGQRSRFLVLTKRSAASGDENELVWLKWISSPYCALSRVCFGFLFCFM